MTTQRSRRSVLPFLLAVVACTSLMATGARASEVAESKKFGIGGVLGQPTGFTLKYHFTPNHALTAAVGIGFYYGHNFHMHVDYGYHFKLVSAADFDLVLWVGGGIKFFYFFYRDYRPYWDRDWQYHEYRREGLGLRVPVGIGFNLNKVPLEVFFELAPGIAFLPWVDFFMDAVVGVRYYF